jgi:hypothetical protein
VIAGIAVIGFAWLDTGVDGMNNGCRPITRAAPMLLCNGFENEVTGQLQTRGFSVLFF